MLPPGDLDHALLPVPLKEHNVARPKATRVPIAKVVPRLHARVRSDEGGLDRTRAITLDLYAYRRVGVYSEGT